MTAPEPFTADALWSAGEVREQSRQVAGQLDVWDAIGEECAWCEKSIPGEPVRDEGQQEWLRPDAWEAWCSRDCHSNSSERYGMRRSEP